MAIAAESATSSRAIATLTMNPALEITTSIDTITTDEMLCGPPRHDPGGSGIAVARIAQLLGAPVTAVFPAGGATRGLFDGAAFRNPDAAAQDHDCRLHAAELHT